MRKQGGERKEGEEKGKTGQEGMTGGQTRDRTEFVRMNKATLLESEASRINSLKKILVLLLFV